MLALSSTLSSPSPLFRSALNLVRGQHQVGHGLSGSERQVGDMASDRRAMLEPVTAAASDDPAIAPLRVPVDQQVTIVAIRSEEHTSELQSLMRISYAVFCLKKNKKNNTNRIYT